MFNLNVSTGNAAFVEDGNAHHEIARILREVAAELDNLEEGGHVRDYNGNRVGAWEYTPEPEDTEDDN